MADIPAQTGNAQVANWEAQMNIEGFKLPRRIGVCINYGAHIWYQLQSATERDLATQLGIELEAIDANMDADLQARQVERFLEQDVDVLIYSAVNPTLAPGVLKQVHKAGVPVITESIWVDSPAVATNVMINDYKGGQKIGRVAASWIKEHSQGPVKVLDVTAPWLPEGLQRSDGFLAGLREEVPEFETIRLDGRADIKTSAEVVAEVLRRDPTYTMIFGVDDESAIGARHAYEQLQIPLDNVCICSFGFSGQQAYDWLNNGVYHIVCAMFPEYQARMLVHAAIYAYNRRQLPRHLVGPCAALTADELPLYYTRTAEGVQLHVDAVKAISTDGESLV